MTTPAHPTGLQTIVARTHHLLLDFDGPVCAIFAGIPAHVVADQLRGRLHNAGVKLPESAADMTDPLEVFRTVASTDQEVAAVAERELTRLELEAVRSARPTPGANQLLTAACENGRTVTIVTNNSVPAVRAYLAAHHLPGFVTAVVGRDEYGVPPDPARMKPSPYLVRKAISILDVTERECALVGDSPSDVRAGHLAGVAVIGFANKPGKTDKLTHAGADAVTTRLSKISAALAASPTALGRFPRVRYPFTAYKKVISRPCPTCGAQPGETCHTKDGTGVPPHPARHPQRGE